MIGAMTDNPEVGSSIVANGITTNYHVAGEGPPVILVHGSGPGVSAWANWRLNIGALAERNTVYALDMVGFGFTERPEGIDYSLTTWREHAIGFADALGLDRFSLVGNSFGGALALSVATTVPDRVHKLVLMGAVGVPFEITEGLDRVFTAAGFEWREPGCSMCLAMNPDKLSPGERAASTSNRNFEGRQGRGGRTHLVSPAVAAATAIAGTFATPDDLEA